MSQLIATIFNKKSEIFSKLFNFHILNRIIVFEIKYYFSTFSIIFFKKIFTFKFSKFILTFFEIIDSFNQKFEVLIREIKKFRFIQIFVDDKIKILIIFEFYQNEIINILISKFQILQIDYIDINIIIKNVNKIIKKTISIIIILIIDYFNSENFVIRYNNLLIFFIFLFLTK